MAGNIIKIFIFKTLANSTLSPFHTENLTPLCKLLLHAFSPS